MARYDYKCSSCGNVFEVEHPMSETPEVVCPSCGAEMGRTKYDPEWVDEMAMLDEIWGDDD